MNILIDKFIEKLMRESTPEIPIWNVEGAKSKWNYVDGCMMISLLEMYNQTNDKKYLDFVTNFVDFYIFKDGTIRGYDINDYNLDDVCESRVLFDLYEKTKNEKYRKAIEFTYKHIQTQPRTKESNFWHKLIYPNQIWLDGLFMAQPFYARYETTFNNKKNYNDIITQFKNVRKIMFDENSKLYYHGYDSEKTIFWADKQTGLSKNFWTRAIGWFTIAIIDVISLLDEKEPTIKEFFAPLLKEIVDGLLQYQDSATKMFYQVTNMGTKEGNYLETSGSSLISFSILKAVRLNILPIEYQKVGLDIFNGVCDNRLTEVNGDLNLEGICLVAGLGPENNLRRDGTFEYYISEPIVKNDAKGVAPLIMAYSEVIRIK